MIEHDQLDIGNTTRFEHLGCEGIGVNARAGGVETQLKVIAVDGMYSPYSSAPFPCERHVHFPSPSLLLSTRGSNDPNSSGTTCA